jgi:membrane fusion protein (multidrug efflux system)
MSNEFLKAADDARRLLAGFSAVATVADAFEKVGGLQQAKAEAEKAIPKLKAEAAAASAELAQARADLKQAKEDAKDIVAKANDAASGILADAQRKAVEAAEASDAASASAKATLDAMFAGADARIADLQAAHDKLAGEVKDLEARADRARAYLQKLAT